MLGATRPTAVNLFWAIEKMKAHIRESNSAPEALAEELLRLAQEMHEEDVAVCRRIGDLGATLLPEGSSVLTHCNAGALATAGYGTAGRRDSQRLPGMGVCARFTWTRRGLFCRERASPPGN